MTIAEELLRAKVWHPPIFWITPSPSSFSPVRVPDGETLTKSHRFSLLLCVFHQKRLARLVGRLPLFFLSIDYLLLLLLLLLSPSPAFFFVEVMESEGQKEEEITGTRQKTVTLIKRASV